MRRISLALALVGAVAAAGCGGAGNSNSSGRGGSRGVAQGTFTIVVQNGQNGNPGLAIRDGYVTSNPPGLDCGTGTHVACSATFPIDSAVTLTATASAGKVFLGWAADCVGLQNTCSIAGKAADQYVLALFGNEADRGGHPNWSVDPADPNPPVHATAARDLLRNVPGSLHCANCHGASLEGAGLAVSCATCHGSQGTPGVDAAAVGETSTQCHAQQGTSHQAVFDQYADPTKLTATIDSVVVTATTTVPTTWKTVVKFTLKKDGVAVTDLTTSGAWQQKRYSMTEFDPVLGFVTSTATSFSAAVATGTAGQYSVTAANAKFQYTAKNAFLYFYFGDKLVMPADGHYNLMDNVLSLAAVNGTVDYTSAANVSACEQCHGAPYSKHGYRQATVAGLNDFVACKACHTDQRAGTDFDWQVLANEPEWLASASANGTATPDWTTGFGLWVANQYPYIANVMNDTHMSHAMEFPYPQSMANCATCHAGKLARITADSMFVGSVCASCHPTRGLHDTPKRAPSFEGEKLGAALAYHDFQWPQGTILHDDGAGGTVEWACNVCHADNIADNAPGDTSGAIDGQGPMLYGFRVPLFKDLHPGFNSVIYDAAGAKYSDTIAANITGASYDSATRILTVNFNLTGAAAGAIMKPTVVMSLYGYDTKDFIVGGHGSAADGKRNLEWAVASSSNGSRLTVSPATASAGPWTATANLSSWASYIDSAVVSKVEIGVLPSMGLNQALEPDLVVTSLTYNPYIAVKGSVKTFDLAANALLDDATVYGKAIVDSAKCNKCHDALGVEFHSPSYGSAGVVACRLCHVVGSGGSHLEMQSRSIDSYVHAIHAFQAFDINGINFADDVETMEYNHHVGHTYPYFSQRACTSCHNAGTFDTPDQQLSLAGILSASSVVTGKTRMIGNVPSVVTGPAARACGSCHRANLIRADDAAGLGVLDAHTKAFGYRVLPASPSEKIADTLLRVIDALF